MSERAMTARLIERMGYAVAILGICAAAWSVRAADDPLPSWNDGAARQAIVDFVEAVTTEGGADFVPPEDRIATFDQDGTLWVEHPLYTQAMFALDRVGEMAPEHPEWKDQEPFKSVLTGDREAIARFTEGDWAHIIAATHAGMTNEAFLQIVQEWLGKAKDPRFKRPPTALIYQPMLEVMEHLRANGFRTHIVTGGGQEFVRVYSEEGLRGTTRAGGGLEHRHQVRTPGRRAGADARGQGFLHRRSRGKAIGINLFIGKRPYAAFGNSGGDREMLEWTGAGAGARLMMLVLHDDAEREYAYGPANGLPDTKVGTFSQALYDEAKMKGWVVISMKDDWKTVFPEGDR
jgi:haloacid dehalogenase-like hydrolase